MISIFCKKKLHLPIPTMGILGSFISLVLSLFIGSSALGQSAYREESGVLEQVYESRVRSALNNVFRPNEYSVVVSVDINQDQKQLDALETQMENMNLPGVAGLVLPENMGMSNKLHGLRNRVSVHLLIDQQVSKEKEEAAKTSIQMRLHMDEAAGDVVSISRAVLLPPKDPPPPPDLLPELSWRMWALVIIISLLALGLLIYAIQKRKEFNLNSKLKTDKASENENDKQDLGRSPQLPVLNPLEADSLDQTPPSENDRDMIELYERKRSLVSIAKKFPEAASKSLEEQFEKGHQTEVVAVLDHLGWEESKALFRGMSHRTWSKVGTQMVSNEQKPTVKSTLAAFEHCQKNVVAKYLELADGDLSNPFSFIAKMPQEDLSHLVQRESPQDLAIICAYLESSEKASLIEALPTDLQQATLIQLTKIKEINYDRVKVLSDQLKLKLKAVKESPSKTLDGISFLVDLLRQLDVNSEYRFLHKLALDNPQEFEKLRQVYLMFNDLVHIPVNVVSEAFATVDMTIVTESLFHAPSEVRYHCLKALPEKRAKMIEKDLSYTKDQSHRISLTSQRIVLQAVNTVLLMSDLSISQWVSKPHQPEQAVEAA